MGAGQAQANLRCHRGEAHRPHHHGRHDRLRLPADRGPYPHHRRVPQAPALYSPDGQALLAGYRVDDCQLPELRYRRAYYIHTDGTVRSSSVYRAYFAPRPAFYLQSQILVSFEDGEESKELSDYTELELLGELQRRVQK